MTQTPGPPGRGIPCVHTAMPSCVQKKREGPQEAREHWQALVGLTAPIRCSRAEGLRSPKSNCHGLLLLPMVTGWSSGPRKPEPPTMLTPGLRGWRSGIQAEVSPGWTASYNSLYSPLQSGPHPQVRAKEHAHSMLNHIVAAHPQKEPFP